MQQDIQTLEENGTYEVFELRTRKVAIGCKWLFKIKYKAYDEIDRFKVRLIA